jgi:hypothetical protein
VTKRLFQVPHGGVFGERRRWSAKRAARARELAHQLWPDKVAADPKDDKKPEPTPNQRMNELLKAGRMNQVNTDKDPVQHREGQS